MQYGNSCLTSNITKALQLLHLNFKIGFTQMEKYNNAVVESISFVASTHQSTIKVTINKDMTAPEYDRQLRYDISSITYPRTPHTNIYTMFFSNIEYKAIPPNIALVRCGNHDGIKDSPLLSTMYNS